MVLPRGCFESDIFLILTQSKATTPRYEFSHQMVLHHGNVFIILSCIYFLSILPVEYVLLCALFRGGGGQVH